MANYELWLTDDAGKRLRLLEDAAYFSYMRVRNGLGTFSFGIPYEAMADLITVFKPDWRVEVWRSPKYGMPMRMEDTYLLRKPDIYTRVDNTKIIRYYGLNGMDLLRRRCVIQRAGTSWARKTGKADDVMKAFVREQMLYGSALDKNGTVDSSRAWPQNEFLVQSNGGYGPVLTRDFAGKNLFDSLKDIANTTRQLNTDNPATYQRIYFDVAPIMTTPFATTFGSVTGFEFRTYAGIRGIDRTAGIPFSLENGNIEKPEYSKSHLDEANTIIIQGNGQGLSQILTEVSDTVRVNASRWNRVEKVISAGSETTTGALQDAGRAELFRSRPQETMKAIFLNTGGGSGASRSLYGLDWDLGDRLRVEYAGIQFEMEVSVIYVSIKEDGEEDIYGEGEAVYD